MFDTSDDELDHDSLEEEAEEAITSLGGLSNVPKPSNTPTSSKNDGAPKPLAKKPPTSISQYGDLSANHTSAQHASTATSLDSSIYEYDAVYDSLHAKKASSTFTGATGPKYMSNLLAAAEIRKRDALRAKEKMLAREREAEGDDFADKEKFVTGAYKAQQEEVRRMEAEEVRREEEEMERRRKQGGGMVGLYRGLLDRDEKRHEEVVKAAEVEIQGAGTSAQGDHAMEGLKLGKSDAELAREKGAVVNDDGVVVDKRQLLSAGLNVAAKPKPFNLARKGDAAAAAGGSGMPTGQQGRGGAKQAMRERQSRMLETQLEEASKRAADDEDVQREALERAAKSRRTEGDIMGAKERYLQRKKEAAAAASVASGEK